MLLTAARGSSNVEPPDGAEKRFCINLESGITVAPEVKDLQVLGPNGMFTSPPERHLLYRPLNV